MKERRTKRLQSGKVARYTVERKPSKKTEIVYGDYKDVLENLVRAVQQAYPPSNDKVRPGVVISFLQTGEWYVSLKRYRTPNDSFVVISQRGKTLSEAIYVLADNWTKNLHALDALQASLDEGWRGDPT